MLHDINSTQDGHSRKKIPEKSEQCGVKLKGTSDSESKDLGGPKYELLLFNL